MEDKKQKQRDAVKRYEANHDRINVLFAKGTRDRIQDTDLGVSASQFIQFSTEFMLNYIEHRKHESEV